MIRRHIPVWVAIALASVATAFADPPANIYVTTGAGRHVLAIPIDPVTGTQGGAALVLVTADSPLTDVTQKSDGGLYYATATEIRRVGQAGPVATVAGAQELRFSAYNCLFYNRTTGGVNSVGCGTGAAAGGGGRGLAFDLFGNLLAISGTTVVRIPVDRNGVLGTPAPVVTSGLGAPKGIAVAAGEGTNGLERGDFVVLDGRHARLYDGKSGTLKNPKYAEVPVGQSVWFADFDADDRLWLASGAAAGGTAAVNGRVYRADAGGAVCTDQGGTNCVLAATLPFLDGAYWPAIGLALGPSSRLLTQSMAPTVPNSVQTFTFDFGASIVQIAGTVLDSCDLRVRSSLTPAPDASAMLTNTLYSINPYLGDEGFPTVYRIEVLKGSEVVNAAACLDTVNKPTIFIAALTATATNPRVVRCESGCSEIEMLGWWHTGPIENDGEGGGRIDDFSDWLIVEKAVAPPAGQIQFCSVRGPLAFNKIPVLAPGSAFTVRVQFSAPGQPCGSGIVLTDPNAKFLLALARVAPDHERILIDPVGVPPILRKVDRWYEFDLVLKDAEGVNYEDGTYEITLTDVTVEGTRLPSPVRLRFRIATGL